MTAVEGSTTTAPAFAELEQHRRALTAYCYRMLGSPFEAEDAVQDTLLRAWRNLDRFEGRSALRSWLYRIATNVCLDMLSGRERRARPMDLGPNVEPVESNLNVLPEVTWIAPVPDALVSAEDDPALVVESRETIRLAFVAALQHLPPRQRAVLILSEVLRWRATEVAELLDTTVASVNSALQRARGTIDAALPERAFTAAAGDERELLQRYLAAWNAGDIDDLVGLLREDAEIRMPDRELVGAREIGLFLRDVAAAGDLRKMRLTPTRANGRPAVVFHRIADDGTLIAHGVQVIEIADGRIAGFDAFIDAKFLPVFGFAATPVT
jgi:RNA polymerase sigma-70 factor (ECF subfamily)